MRFFRSRFTGQRNCSIAGSKVSIGFKLVLVGPCSAIWSKSLSPRVPGAPDTPKAPKRRYLDKKKQRANLKSLRCNSLFEARRHSFLGRAGSVSLPGLPLLNWQRSPQRRRTGDEAARNNLLTREGSRVFKRAPIQAAKEVILGQTNQFLHFCYIVGITS